MSESFINPLSFGTIQELLTAILNIMIIVSTPIVVIFIIYSGFLYVTARGDVEQVKQAARSLTYGIIGGVIIVGAVAIVRIVDNLANSF